MRFFDVLALHHEDFTRAAELLKSGANEDEIVEVCWKVMRQIENAMIIYHTQDDDYQIHAVGNLHITYDRLADAYYIYLRPKQKFLHSHTETEERDMVGLWMVNYDVDVEERIYGIELLAHH